MVKYGFPLLTMFFLMRLQIINSFILGEDTLGDNSVSSIRLHIFRIWRAPDNQKINQKVTSTNKKMHRGQEQKFTNGQ